MFVFELALGWLAQSTGLIADSLDMFADAAVYAISLYAVGKSAALQAGSVRLSGFAQILLALLVLADVYNKLRKCATCWATSASSSSPFLRKHKPRVTVEPTTCGPRSVVRPSMPTLILPTIFIL